MTKSSQNKKTGLSIVIPAYNEEKYIANCIESLIKQQTRQIDLEILIIDGNSTDKTAQIVEEYHKKYPFVKRIPNPDRITPVALNIGIQAAQKEYIMISGAHAAFASNYIEKCLEILQNTGADGVGGILHSEVKNSTPKSRAIAKVLSSPSGVGNSMFRVGVKQNTEVDTLPFGIYHKSVFEKVGLYNTKLIRNHDIELSKRMKQAGLKLILTPETYGIYYTRETFKDLAKNNFLNGKWNILTVLLTNNLKSLSLRHFVPALYILAILFFALLSPFIFMAKVAFTGVLISYLSFITFFSIKLTDGTTYFHLILWAHIVLHHAYAIGSLSGFLDFFKRQLFKKQ